MLLLAALASLLPASAGAHGALTTPGSRTWLCKVDGTHSTGDIVPNNAACADAIAQGGKQPLWDWFGVLRPDGAGRTRGYIPDGRLCSGGNDTYIGYDQARADWPHTRVASGAEIRFAYNAWAPHPGEFRLYLTKEGFDPSTPLGWDDLDEQPFSTYAAANPNATDQVNQTPEYAWSATLPARTGAHIIYSIWQRSDSDETFYGCSDVMFDGGSGEVVGIGPAGAQTLADLAPAAGAGNGQPTATTIPAAPTDDPATSEPTSPPAAPSEEPEAMADGGDLASGSSLPALPVPQQPAVSGTDSGTGAAAGTAAIGLGATAIVVIGLGGVLLGIVATVAVWALVELRKAHRKLAGLEDALWIETEGIESGGIEGEGIEGEAAVDREVRTRDPLGSLMTAERASQAVVAEEAGTTGDFELQPSGR